MIPRAAFLLFAFATAAASAADLVLLGGKIVTMDPAQPEAEALAATRGRIVFVGSQTEVQRHLGPQTRVLDLRGKLAVPGFIESHGHFVSLGLSQMMLDLSKAQRWQDIIEQVRSAADKREDGEWIVGRGWHQAKWKAPPLGSVDGYPVHDRLSEASRRNPVLLTHASGHMCIANAEAMRLAGIDDKTKPPVGGEILRTADGRPTGVFRETAQSLVHRARSRHRTTAEQRRLEFDEAVRLAAKECLTHGVTTFQDAGSSLAEIQTLRGIAEQGQLPVRLWVMIRDSNERLERALPQVRQIGGGEGHFTVRAIKRSIDGALGSHGAWLLDPYEDLPRSRGLNTATVKSIQQTAELALKHDFQLCVHAIGDRANRETLDVFQRALAAVSDGSKKRWRVEHAQHVHPVDIPRFAKLGVIASMQAIHCTSDAPYVVERLGYRRAAQGAYVWRRLLDSGALIANGTDTPVERVDPIACFDASVTRRLPNGKRFFPEQCMSRHEALRSYTLHAAYAAFEEDEKGSLVKGKLADIAVLTKDIMSCPPREIGQARVAMTIVGGKILFND